ncbi:MAG: hypothetical protein KJZ87_02490 [Thermoguttaceae bacterium]|nr:hypothetical protein [Thermoguttaceae bacterium]
MGLWIRLGMLLAVLRSLLELVLAVLDSLLLELELLRVMGMERLLFARSLMLCSGGLGVRTGHFDHGCTRGTSQSAYHSAANVAYASSTGSRVATRSGLCPRRAACT